MKFLWLRGLLFLFAAIGLMWSFVFIPLDFATRPFDVAGFHIRNGMALNEASLDRLVERGDFQNKTICSKHHDNNAVLIQFRHFEMALQKGYIDILDQRQAALEASLQKSLRCDPHQGFTWFIVYWLEQVKGDPDNLAMTALGRSYQYSPYEGWIMRMRARYALPHLLRSDFIYAEQSKRDFIRLATDRYKRDAAKIFIGLPTQVRDILLIDLQDLNEEQKHAFRNALRQENAPLRFIQAI